MKNYFYIYFFSIFVFLTTSCGSNVKKNTSHKEFVTHEKIDAYSLAIKPEGLVPYSGYANFDKFQKSNATGMSYPGYNAASFLASVLAHALISKSVDESRINKFIKDSNEAALDNCRGLVDNFTVDELKNEFMQQHSSISHAKFISMVDSINSHQIPLGHIESDPMFILTQNNDVLIVENRLKVRPHKEIPQKEKRKSKSRKKKKVDDNFLYENVIVVISEKNENEVDFFSNTHIEQLKALSINTYADSMDLFINDFAKSKEQADLKYETIRFCIGNHYRVERGQPIVKSKDRIIYKTLRGWIKSVPQDSSCKKTST